MCYCLPFNNLVNFDSLYGTSLFFSSARALITFPSPDKDIPILEASLESGAYYI